jgi:hypothetical protein
VVLSLAAVILGVVASFLVPGRQAIMAMALAAIIALTASAIGVSNIGASVPNPGAAPVERPVSAVGQINLQYGYFITVAGLLVAIAACAAALSGRRSGAPSP